MEITLYPPKNLWSSLSRRPLRDDPQLRARVEEILQRVLKDGDIALRQLSLEIDHKEVALAVTESELEAAESKVPADVRQAISQAAANIRAFHQAQLPREIRVETMPGVTCIQRPVPIRRAGLYIPGGTAPLFSTVLMLAIPAVIAGCQEIILCSPAGPSGEIAPEVLSAAHFCGIRRVFRVGGAQAIAAMAYGTASIPRADKIFGPGNRYVTTAKQLLGMQNVAIDMPAGPSEVMVLADDTAIPAFVAADLLSQAEHGADSQVILLCLSESFAKSVTEEMNKQLESLSRTKLTSEALTHSRIIVMEDLEKEVEFAENYAPEHLILAVRNPASVARRITSAGSVFIGAWSPESAGDYASGTNHTLPTGGWAHAFSGVNVDCFMRKMTLQELTPDGLRRLAPSIISMARAEGLDAHARAVTLRLTHIDALMRPNIRAMAPYSTARDECSGTPEVFLDANESPYQTGWNRYPDPRQPLLKQKISALKGVGQDSIFIGNGSDEAIDLMYRIFCEPGRDKAIILSPSYGMYTVAAQANDVEVCTVPLGDNYSLPSLAIAETANPDTKLLFICSPNNPTGNAFSLEELSAVIEQFSGITVVDEAYVDFSSKGSLLPYLSRFPRLVILQTLSKAYGLAGLRVGMAFADASIIRAMDRVKYPYNVNQPAQQLAFKALDKPVGNYIREILAQREILAGILAGLPYVQRVFPSDANFLLVKVDAPRALYDYLLAQGIIVRDRSCVIQCEGCLRISIGTPEENRRLTESLILFAELNAPISK